MFSILLLAFGLVIFTVIGVAESAHRLFAGFDWKLGLVLGAVIAPTDALAATSIAERVGIPKRITDLIEGESLVNDATGLLAIELGTAMVIRNELRHRRWNYTLSIPDDWRLGRRPDCRLDCTLG